MAAALACAGGAVFVDHGGSVAGAANTPVVAPVTLDHYLCTGDSRHGGCDPTTESLPNGTSFGINNPGDSLTCTWGRGHDGPASTVAVTNEFSSTPVPLTTGRFVWTCSLLPAVQSATTHADVAPVPLTTFACTWVRYPSRTSARFTPPFPVTVGANVSVRVLDPGVLCVQTGAAAGATAMDLVCFPARVVSSRRRFFAPVLGLCVPGVDPAPTSSSTTSSTTTSSTTSSSTTSTTTKPTTTSASSTTTTTTKPTTTSSSTTSSTTTSTTKPATTTSSTTTSTTTATSTTTSGTQPCVGTLINGMCFVNL